MAQVEIHPTAIVDPGARLGAGVRVGPYAIIGDGVTIGDGTTVGPHAVVRGPTTIGRNNRIFQFAVLGEEPQDKKYAGEPTRLEVGDGNTFREFCTVHRGTVQDEGVTRIGNGNWVMAYVHIAHDCRVGNDVIFSNNATLAGHVHVADHVVCSGFSAVHQFCRLGAHCFLGGFAAVTRDVPPYVMAAGQPLAPHGINTEGLKRRGFAPDQLRNLKEAYRILYREGLQLAEARARLADLAATQPELRILVEFLDQSERSIVR
jgi:UDP-N-acetylglucosamine acyltransferase